VAALSGSEPPAPGGDGATEILLGDEQGLLAAFRLRDELRPGAREAIAELRRLGLTPLLYSGDSEDAVAGVARELEIADFCARMRPEDKLAGLRALAPT